MKSFLFAIPGLFICILLRSQSTELYRPQFHFSPATNWTNDPNGLIYYKGEYHLFYQHYPNAPVWGPMHWGHAVSNDLIHWQHLPIALYPDSLGYIFSGSAVVDKTNSSGFKGHGEETPLLAMYTYHNMEGEKSGRSDFQTQGIAYSLDRGRSWIKYQGNPVIKNAGVRDFRDPKVMWYAPSNKWIVTLAAGDHIEFYSSADFKVWTKESEFGKDQGHHSGVWECPDLIQLKDSVTKTEKWILIVNIGSGAPNGGSGTQYFVGRFEGSHFINDNPSGKTLWLEYGKDNYAGVTFSNTPNHRTILMGWMSNWQYAEKVPTTSWRNAMTIPRELSLFHTPSGFMIKQNPVIETINLRSTPFSWSPLTIQTNKIIGDDHIKKEIEIEIDLPTSSTDDFGIVLSNHIKDSLKIGFNRIKNQFYIDRTHSGITNFSKEFPVMQYAPRLSAENTLKMRLLIDVSSVELFADDGLTTMTSIHFPNENLTKSEIFCRNGNLKLRKAKCWVLR